MIYVDNEVQLGLDTIDAKLKSLGEQEWQTEYLLEMKHSELIRRYGRMLNFGTRLDYGNPEAALRYFEEKEAGATLSPNDAEALNNRRMLFAVMTKAGLEPYAYEWWHYNDPASQMGAKVAGRKYAEYGAIDLNNENKQYAQMRKQHHLKSLRLAQGEEWTPPKGLEVHYKLARAAIIGNNPKNIRNMTDMVAKIEPQSDDMIA